MGSLPRFLRPNLNSFRNARPLKLQADNQKKLNIRSKINGGKFKKIVGISWKSKNDPYHKKSLSLEQFILGIYSPNIHFVCLQYGEVTDEINEIRNKYGIEISEVKEVDKFNDIDSLAALISACDEVVSIENITAFLAGGLGKKSHILLSNNCLWCSGYKDAKHEWYPSVQNFRQSNKSEWILALEQIKKILNFHS